MADFACDERVGDPPMDWVTAFGHGNTTTKYRDTSGDGSVMEVHEDIEIYVTETIS